MDNDSHNLKADSNLTAMNLGRKRINEFLICLFLKRKLNKKILISFFVIFITYLVYSFSHASIGNSLDSQFLYLTFFILFVVKELRVEFATYQSEYQQADW
jgi:hypothetical protein